MSRYLTVLLTDIVGFSSQAQSLPREGVMALLESHRMAVLPTVERRGGKVIKEIGDAFLIVFESPTDALHAAQEIRDAARSHQTPSGIPLALRMAVSAGDITETENDVFGDAVNMASRLESETPAHRIWTTDTVGRGIKRAEIRMAKIGALKFKGYDDAVQIYEAFPPEEQYYCVVNGQSEGPFARADIHERARFQKELQIWDAASEEWRRADAHPHFMYQFIDTAPGTAPVRRKLFWKISAAIAGIAVIAVLAGTYAWNSADDSENQSSIKAVETPLSSNQLIWLQSLAKCPGAREKEWIPSKIWLNQVKSEGIVTNDGKEYFQPPGSLTSSLINRNLVERMDEGRNKTRVYRLTDAGLALLVQTGNE